MLDRGSRQAFHSAFLWRCEITMLYALIMSCSGDPTAPNLEHVFVLECWRAEILNRIMDNTHRPVMIHFVSDSDNRDQTFRQLNTDIDIDTFLQTV